jgi:rod shape-determining protein MreC
MVEFSMPVSKAVSLPINFIVDNIINFHDLVDIRNQNLILAKENSKLKSLYIQSLHIKQENSQLKEIVKYTGARSTKYIATKLIAQSYQTYNNDAFISSGEAQGVLDGDIVIGRNALIGRVSQVGDHKSRVLLVTDINSHIPIIISGSNIKGVLAGDNSNVMRVLHLNKSAKINVGDMVFTSGDGDSIPPGFLIGVVTKFSNNNARVEVAENIKDLDIVSVISY